MLPAGQMGETVMSDKQPVTPAMFWEMWKRCPNRVKRVAIGSGAAVVIVFLVVIVFGGGLAMPLGLAVMLGILITMIKEIDRTK